MSDRASADTLVGRLIDAVLDVAVISFAAWTLLYCLGLPTQWSLWPSGWIWLGLTLVVLVWRVRLALPAGADDPSTDPDADHGRRRAAAPRPRARGRPRPGRRLGGRRPDLDRRQLPFHLGRPGARHRDAGGLELARRPGPPGHRGGRPRRGTEPQSLRQPAGARGAGGHGRHRRTDRVRAPGRHRRPLLPQPLGLGRRARQRLAGGHDVQPRGVQLAVRRRRADRLHRVALRRDRPPDRHARRHHQLPGRRADRRLPGRAGHVAPRAPLGSAPRLPGVRRGRRVPDAQRRLDARQLLGGADLAGQGDRGRDADAADLGLPRRRARGADEAGSLGRDRAALRRRHRLLRAHAHRRGVGARDPGRGAGLGRRAPLVGAGLGRSRRLHRPVRQRRRRRALVGRGRRRGGPRRAVGPRLVRTDPGRADADGGALADRARRCRRAGPTWCAGRAGRIGRAGRACWCSRPASCP